MLVDYMRHRLLCYLLFVGVMYRPCTAQVIPYFPVEISFSPCGVSNQIPAQPNDVSTISSLRMVFFKEPLTTRRVSSSISFDGVLDFYHNLAKTRNYNPLYTNAVSNTMLFVNDIFTLGTEVIGNVVTEVGTDKNNTIFNQFNYRARVRPFFFVVLTPDLILKEYTTIGMSRYGHKTKVPGVPYPIKKDYDIYKAELNLIYFTPFKTRIFLSPYLYTNRYYELFKSNDTLMATMPALREEGIGCALGFLYTTPGWGFSMAAFEYERNVDKISGANNYHKLKAYTKWENIFLTDRLGYSIGLFWTSHMADKEGNATGFGDNTNPTGELGQNELIIDIMPNFNFNKFLSIRPEYEFIYRDLKTGPTYKRNLFRLFFYVRF